MTTSPEYDANASVEARSHADRAAIASANAERINNVHPNGWVNPHDTHQYNLVVIGAGPAGLAAARTAASLGARVALVERHLVGGDSLNVGCIPSKSLVRTGRAYWDMAHAGHFGAGTASVAAPNIGMTMRRVRSIQARVSRKDATVQLEQEGIDLYFGAARFVSGDALRIDDRTLGFRRALIATGGRQREPEIPGLKEAGYLTVERLFALDEVPSRLMVIGGGPLGTEIAQAYCRLGSRVFLVHDQAKFLPREERDAAQLLSESLARDGVEIHLNTRAVRAYSSGTQTHIDLRTRDSGFSIAVNQVLTGIGRVPNVEELDLRRAGIDCKEVTGIAVDDFLRTTNPRVYAAGDVCLEHKFTHVAEASARIAVENALFIPHKRFSRLTIPWCTYTDPEVAHVGIYVDEANRNDVPLKTYTVMMYDVDRAVADGEEIGFVKIHVRIGTDKIMGATIVARHAGEMINGITLAIQRGVGLADLADVIHVFPTQAMAIKQAADACRVDQRNPLMSRLTRRWLRWRA